jgi:ankyrin repeat protein
VTGSTFNQLFEYCKKGEAQNLLNALGSIEAQSVLDERGHSLLCVALKNGQSLLVKTFLSEGFTFNTKNPPLISACQYPKDECDCLEIALEIDDDINALTPANRTGLMTACLLGHLNKVQLLLASNADINRQDLYGNTALIEAVQSNKKALVKLILQHRPKINHANSQKETALILALRQKTPSEDIVMQLLQAQADPEIVDNNNRSAWLIAKQKHPKIARQIEKHLNSVNQIELPFFTNSYESTQEEPINDTTVVAEQDTRQSLVEGKTLNIEKSSSPEKTSDTSPQLSNQTVETPSKANKPLFFQKEPAKSNQQEWFHAAKQGNLGGLNRMIIEGIDINCTDAKGCTALIRACGHSRRAVVSFLLQQKADIEARSDNGSTALSSSIIGNCRRVAGLLLDKKANPNGLGPADYSYATIAAAGWNDAMLSILYRYKADIFIINKHEQSLLHIIAQAAEYNNNINNAKSCFTFLLDHGLDINTKDKFGNTALMLLCGAHKKRYKVDDRNIASLAYQIIKLGASAALTNEQQRSALDAAHFHKLIQTKGVLMNALSWNDS